MARYIEIFSLESGARAVAELYENEAPKTCEAMWKCLEVPMETDGIQAMWVGRELMFLMPPENQRVDPMTIPEENATQYPVPGDIAFKYYPKGATRQVYRDFRSGPVWDFFIIYGPDAILGGATVSIFAHIVEGLDELATDAMKIREHGIRRYRVSRLSQ